MDQLQPYIDTITQALLAALVATILGGIAVLRKKIEAWVESKTSVQQREVLHRLAGEAAALVEATYEGAGGPEKLSEAYDYVAKQATKLGIPMSGEAIRAAIEKAVQDYNATQNKPPKGEVKDGDSGD